MNKLIPKSIRDRLDRKRTIQMAYESVFSTDMGKIVLRHLAQQGFVNDTTFVKGDPNETLLNEGSRRIVLSIIRKIHRGMDDYEKELQELMQDE